MTSLPHACLGRPRVDHVTQGIRIAELDATVPAADVPEHEHNDAHIVLILNGVYASSARHMPEAAAPMTVVANPPGTAHRDRFLDLPGRYLVIEIQRDLWGSAPGQDTNRPAVRMPAETLSLLLSMRASLHQDPADLERRREELVLELCAKATGVASVNRRPPAWLERIRERYHEHCTRPPPLTEAARDAGVHPTSLSRAFRRHYGMTISQWIRNCRIETTARLLARADRPLVEAALAAGFADQAHMSRALRSCTGLTPRSMRRLVIEPR
ncbi:MAG: helix-turn-helix transcriptional regulator [Wenzhouxiangellaceae bacterium]